MKYAKVGLALGIISVLLLGRCKHEPIFPEGYNPNDSIPPVDTTPPPIDTTPPPIDTSNPCLPGVIYFERDVQPILNSSCAVPGGCHDAISHKEGINLTNYTTTMATGSIKPGNAADTKIYKKMIDNDPGDKMPPPSSGITLTQEQINIVRDWINQGAQNLTCNQNAGGCDSVDVSFSGIVQPIINNSCKGCHSGTNPQGSVRLDTHANILLVVNDGRLLKTITHASGVSAMPKNQSKLSDCKIAQIRSWINASAPNN